MVSSRTYAWITGVSVVFLGTYAAAALLLSPGGDAQKAFGNLAQCLVPLLASAGLLLNAGTPHWRRNVFWMLAALSCTLWMIGQFQWTYYEIYLHQLLPDMFAGDIAASIGVPHKKKMTSPGNMSGSSWILFSCFPGGSFFTPSSFSPGCTPNRISANTIGLLI